MKHPRFRKPNRNGEFFQQADDAGQYTDSRGNIYQIDPVTGVHRKVGRTLTPATLPRRPLPHMKRVPKTPKEALPHGDVNVIEPPTNS